jgi:hypothetical protein
LLVAVAQSQQFHGRAICNQQWVGSMVQGFFTDELQFDLSRHYCIVFRSMKPFAASKIIAQILKLFLPILW